MNVSRKDARRNKKNAHTEKPGADPTLKHVRLLRAPEVAHLFGVNVSTVWRMAARVERPLLAVRLGGCTRFRLCDVEQFIEEASDS